MAKKNVMELNFTRLNDLIYELVNEGLPYDEDAENLFTREEFNEINQEYRMYGTLFGVRYVNKLLSLIKEEIENKEDKEN